MFNMCFYLNITHIDYIFLLDVSGGCNGRLQEFLKFSMIYLYRNSVDKLNSILIHKEQKSPASKHLTIVKKRVHIE